jgi:hypothetical protein
MTTYPTTEALHAANLTPGSIVISTLGTAWQANPHGDWFAAAPSQPKGGPNDTYDAPYTLIHLAPEGLWD